MTEYDIVKSDFFVARLAGTEREIGKSLGLWLKESKPAVVEFLTNERFIPEAKGYHDFKELEKMCSQACPGIVEEIEGFAETIGSEMEHIAFWAWTALKGANCSHAAISPNASTTKTSLVMRSYEWNPDQDDLLLCITKKQGAYAHIGCSVITFGRMDGMNEKGLSVTMSGGMAAGLPYEWTYKKGLTFWVVIRGMLEQCANVPESLSFLRENVPTGNHCLILADREGRAILAEMSGGDLVIKDRGNNGFIASVNHFQLPPLDKRNKNEFVLINAIPRLAFIEKTLSNAQPGIAIDTLKSLLAGKAPNGCFGPWYTQGFGTLWASIFDLCKGQAEYCFGAPGFSTWKTFSFEGETGFERHDAIFAKSEE